MGQRPLCSFLLAARSRKVDGERRSPSGCAVDEHQTAMRLHGPLHDRQSQTSAADTASRKWLEQAALQLVRNARYIFTLAQGDGIFDDLDDRVDLCGRS